jgi:hypothetical protein
MDASKGFCHLAPIGVLDANKQDDLIRGHMIVSQA